MELLGIQLRTRLVLVLLSFFIPFAMSAPGGIGEIADDGCFCHGERNINTQVEIQGLPESFEANTTYNFSITVSSQAIPANLDGEIGGFRLLITGGTVGFNSSEGLVQNLENGWTHTETGNAVRHWNLSFTSPSDNASFVDFTVYGNAVNGNQASTGDEWNSVEFRLPGVQYEGESMAGNNDDFSPLDYSVGLVLILALRCLCVITLRD